MELIYDTSLKATTPIAEYMVIFHIKNIVWYVDTWPSDCECLTTWPHWYFSCNVWANNSYVFTEYKLFPLPTNWVDVITDWVKQCFINWTNLD